MVIDGYSYLDLFTQIHFPDRVNSVDLLFLSFGIKFQNATDLAYIYLHKLFIYTKLIDIERYSQTSVL